MCPDDPREPSEGIPDEPRQQRHRDGSVNRSSTHRSASPDFAEMYRREVEADVQREARTQILWEEREAEQRRSANRWKTIKAMLWGAGGIAGATALPQGWLPALWGKAHALWAMMMR